MKHKIEYINVDKLSAYETNSRTHSDDQIKQIADSIKEFGFTNPVLIDQDGTIIAGHGRVQAAKKIIMDEVPCIRLSHLTEAQRKAYVIADNKLAMNAGWDDELLRQEIEALKELDFDIDLLGFDASEIQFNEIDYSVLDDDDLSDKMTDMAGGVKKAIQIEFDIDHYDEASELVRWWRNQGAYVGGMILEFLRKEKDRV
jgi:site-specific DNA-methyltransferase (adenine-specific)